MQTLGYLGPEGTYSHNVALILKKNKPELELSWYNNIFEMALKVKDSELDWALLPIENSIDGAVNATLDILSGTRGVYIHEEYVCPIEANLISNEGVDIKGIKEIFSHPQPVGQCREYINRKLKDAKISYTFSSTAGVAKVKEDGTVENGYAAIGAKEAAEAYGLKIIAPAIQDNSSNETRFILLGRDENQGTKNTKTSLIFSTEDKPGSLFKVLQIFDLFDVNMKRIESRPSKMSLGKYVFFVDIDGDSREQNNHEALRLLKLKTSYCAFLGSYPEYRI